MRQELRVQNYNDDQGNPTGGGVNGSGISIIWQNGPLGRGTERKEPNGAFVEGVLQAALQRLDYYQASKFNCQSNEVAVHHIHAALDALESRTQDRESRKVEGTHAV